MREQVCLCVCVFRASAGRIISNNPLEAVGYVSGVGVVHAAGGILKALVQDGGQGGVHLKNGAVCVGFLCMCVW